MQVIVRKLPKSEVEIEGELPSELFEGYFDRALKKLGENLELDGFRKGKIPENILVSNIPEIRILEEMASLALSDYYPKILSGEIQSEKIDPVRSQTPKVSADAQAHRTSNGIDAINRPEISITKLARKNPLGFKIKTAVLPSIKLPDYKDIAQKIISLGRSPTGEAKIDLEVTDEELEDTIMDIRKSRAPKVHITSPQPSPEGGEGESPFPSQGKAGDEVKEKTPHPDPLLKGEGDSELPEFDDKFVQALGPFKDVADFKEKLKENIKLEKQNQQKEKTRLKIIEKIIEGSEVELPEILIELELDKILYRMESDITQMGLKFGDYLKHLNKTKEVLRKEFRNDAEKKAKLALILNEIAKVEKIVADEEQVAKEIAVILEHYKNADPERARMHAENVLTNEKIFQFLETIQ